MTVRKVNNMSIKSTVQEKVNDSKFISSELLLTCTQTMHLLYTRNKLCIGDYIHMLLTLRTGLDFYLIVVDFMLSDA